MEFLFDYGVSLFECLVVSAAPRLEKLCDFDFRETLRTVHAAALAWGREKYHIDPRRANGRRIKFLTACMTLLSQNSRYIK